MLIEIPVEVIDIDGMPSLRIEYPAGTTYTVQGRGILEFFARHLNVDKKKLELFLLAELPDGEILPGGNSIL